VETLSLLASVVPLGVAAALTPTLFGLQLLVVSGGDWVRRSIAVFVANAAAFVLLGGLVVAGLARLPDQGTGDKGAIYLGLRLGCGLLLVIASVYFFWPHRDLSARVSASIQRRTAQASVWVFFGLAMYFSLTDFSSFLVLLPALHDITLASAELIDKVIALAVVLTLALSPTWLPPAIRGLLGRRITPSLERLYQFVMTYQFPIVGVVCLSFGGYLVVTGLLETSLRP